MTRTRLALAVSAVSGVVFGAVVALSLDSVGPEESPATSALEAEMPVATTRGEADVAGLPPAGREETGSVLLVWTSGGLPDGFAVDVAALASLERASTVRGGEADLLRTRDEQGAVVDETEPGWRIPVDALAVDPSTMSHFARTDDARRTLAGLEPGEALLTASSARLRGIGVGGRLELVDAELEVVGIVDDISGSGAELLVHHDDAARIGVDTERFMLLGHEPDDRDELTVAVAQQVGDSRPIRFRSSAETTWLRHGDAVSPAVFVKLAYGEFAYRDVSGQGIEVDPNWTAEHVVTAEVPILGEVRCHEAMVEPLRAVLDELAAGNLGHLVDPAGFAGCWSPRRIGSGLPMSRHAWGIAVDLNIHDNPRGSFTSQDPRLVDLMRTAGFTWGGTWLVPDPGHYELLAPT